MIATLTNALVKNPIILGLIVLILLVIILWLVITSIRSRSATGTPILQANMPAASLKLATKSVVKSASDLPLNQTMLGIRPEPAAAAVTRQQTLATPVGTPVAMLRIIETVDPNCTGKTYSIMRTPFTIGRQSCDLTIENDRSISHVHAKISYDDQQRSFTITDLSRNGILLAGQRIEREVPARLAAGMVIGFGPKTTAIFEVAPR